MRHVRNILFTVLLTLLFVAPAYADATLPEGLLVIEEQAFLNDTALTGELIIPEGVTEIGAQAFKGCTGITSVVIPDSVVKIGAEAFSGCTGLEGDLLLRYYVDMGDGCFDGVAARVRQETDAACFTYSVSEGNVIITGINAYTLDVIVPQRIDGKPVVGIGEAAFMGFYMTSIELQDGVTSIGDNAFSRCTSLMNVVLPDSVKSIGKNAFGFCVAMEAIALPYALESIGDYAFSECFDLKSIDIPDQVANIGSYAFYGCHALSSVRLSNRLVCINDNTFNSCYVLNNVLIPENVASIGSCAFYECHQLSNIVLPAGLESISDHAFCRCFALQDIVLPTAITHVGTEAFWETAYGLTFHYPLHSITAKTMRASMNPVFCDDVYQCKFRYATDSSDLLHLHAYYHPNPIPDLPAGIVSIRSHAFSASGITSFSVPQSVMSIEAYAFSECVNLMSVTIPDSVTSIGEYAFSRCTSLTSIRLPEGIASLGDATFAYCESLVSVELPSQLISIGKNAFQMCTSLNEVSIPERVTLIGRSAFEMCTNLMRIVIPNSVTSIGDSAFSGCRGLVSITLPDNVSTIGSLVFSGCDSLIEYRYSLHSTTAKTMRGVNNPVFYDRTWQCKFRYASSTSDSLHLIAYNQSNAVPVLPEGIVHIGENAFSRTGITSITIPDTVTSIGKYAFNGCTSLTSVTFPEEPITLEAYSFAGTGLTGHIVFPVGSAIDPDAFYGCSGLTYGVYTEDEKVEFVTREYLVYLMDNAQSPDTLIANMEAEENSDLFEQFIYDAVSFAQGHYDEILLSTRNKRMYLFHEALAVNSSTPEAEFIPTNSRIALESAATVWKEGTELTNQHLFDTVVVLCDEVFLTDIESADVAEAFKWYYTKENGPDEIFTFLVSEGLKPEAAQDVLDAFDFLSQFRLFAKGLEGVTSVYESLVDLYNDLQFLKTLDRNSLLITASIYRASNDSAMREVGDRLWVIATQDESKMAWYLATGHFADFGLRTVVNKVIEKATDALLKPYAAVVKITNAFLNAFTHVGEVPGLVHDLSFAADAAKGTWYVFQNRLAKYHANPTEENLTEAYHAYIVYLTEMRKSQSAFIKLKEDMDSAAFVGMSPVTAQIVEMAKQQLSHLDGWLYRARTIYRLRHEGTWEELKQFEQEWGAQQPSQ